MANIFDYLDWRGDLTLSERAFNEVDNLILAEICYLDLSGFAPAGFETRKSRSARHGMPILLPIRPPIWVFWCRIRFRCWFKRQHRPHALAVSACSAM